ncbi:MAG: hypothetical protein H7X70_04670 [Candidatus Kapabacteria bacterium]|nr:hypothetical protein [Candidatus Kapabacteria bacterium]
MLSPINRLAILCILVMLIGNDALAIPQFSALTGNRCSNCHVNTSGGGIRNDLGWYSWYDVGIIPRDAAALKWMYDADSSNQFFDGKLTLGMDLRAQSARGFIEGSERKIFPMQASLYAAFTPVKAVTLEGSFNLAALRKGPNTDVRIVYPGQRMGSFSGYFMPDVALPTIRVGLFRPSIGVRYDDHTMAPYSYANANIRQTYLAPDWSEYGTEISYEGLRWLTLQAGVFGSEGLSQMLLSDGVASSSAIAGNSPTITSRAVFWPRFANDIINTWIGGSYLFNNDFSMTSVFASVGWSDHVALMLDYTITNKTGVIRSRNLMAELSYQIFSPVLVYARYERYFTDQINSPGTVSTNAGVLGAQIFVLPYVELRPEFRLWDTWKEGTSNRWAVQLHIFY